MKHSKKSGFTLVELAIVLVIIGLIIGGVLVGQDLIKAATIRSVITDVEKYNAAATTFRSKYNGLPGDLLNTRAVEFGFNTAANDGNRDGTAGRGDGNGAIEGCAAGGMGFGCETALFWRDVSQAGFIPRALNTYTSTLAAVAVNTMRTYVPTTKLRDSTLVGVYSNSGRNGFVIGGMSNAAIAAVGAPGAVTYDVDTTTSGLSPLEARSIDEKVDDGAPLTGSSQAIAAGTNPSAVNGGNAAAAANRCVNGTAAATASYTSTTDAFLNNPACAINIRASF